MWIADKLIYRNEDDFIRAYQGSELVWELPTSLYYVSWNSWNSSYHFRGSFNLNGTHYLEEFYPSNYYSYIGNGVIPESAFYGLPETPPYASDNAYFWQFETNATRVMSNAFGRGFAANALYLSNCSIVDAYAFNNAAISSVSLPVCKYVGDYAFQGCTYLTNASFPMCSYVGSYAFDSCTSLTRVSLPVCSSIRNYTFRNCRNLSKVYLPVCEYVGSYAFSGCRSLSSINLPECSYIGNGAFYYYNSSSSSTYYTRISSISLPKCEYIGGGAFTYCPLLSSIDLPMCSYIGGQAFESCYSLSQASLPMCEYVGDKAFDRCHLLSEANLPMCSYIGYLAFADCSSMSQVSLPMCTSISVNAFAHTQISYVYLPECIDFGGFGNCHSLEFVSAPKCLYIHKNALWNDENITRIEFPECLSVEGGIWDWEDYRGANGGAFGNCDNLRDAELLKCEYLGAGAFAHCSNLIYVNLPVCSYVGSGAFQGCWNLPEIDLPKCKYLASFAFRRVGTGEYTSVSMKLSYINLPECSYIGAACFNGCGSLGRITLGYSGVCSLIGGAFASTLITSTTGFIYVPASLVDAYKSDSVWSEYSNRIFPIT